MSYWILKIVMMHGMTEYPYKFLEKKNCQKVGKDLTLVVKGSYYTCKLKKGALK
jgi:hypothetical protein